MKRQGKYTKKPTIRNRARYAYAGRFGWWKRLSWKKRIIVIALPILGILILIPLATYAYYAQDIADPERLMNRNQTGVVLMDKDGQEFYRNGTAENRKLVPLDQISDNVEKALIASEDKDFYKHKGFSIDGIFRAIFGTITSQEAYGGGSTLTQQLAKNTLLSADRSFLRKYQELAISIAIEQRYNKDEILDMYLNSVFFGGTDFGIEEAAKTYFNKSPNDLTLAESTMLIGILPSPNAYSPTNGNATYAKERQTYVLKRMVEDGFITQAESDAASAVQLAYAPPEQTEESHAQHFALMVIDELNKKYGEEAVLRSGFRVKTTLDLDWQKQAESIVATQGTINARGKGDSAALVAIDPKTGEIRALVGSPDWNNAEFGKINFATNARQPGSSFKPIYFTEALNKKQITPATIIRDEATDFNGYKPNNYDFKFRGDITVRNALAQSLNIPAVKVMQELGIDDALSTAKRMGITTLGTDSSKYGLSLALGAGEVTPLEMTNAYAAFANGGRQYKPTTLLSVDNKFGANRYTHTPVSERVTSTEASFLISDILSDNSARAPTFGSSLNTSRDTAVKTGSTDDNRDAWTIGYTPTIAVGVWVGNHANEIMTSGGSGMAGPIWRKSIEVFFKDVANEQFTQPGTVQQASMCRGTEKRALNDGSNTFREFFITGTVPSATCNASTPQPEVTTPPPTNNGDDEQNDDEEEQQPEEPENPTDPTDPTNPTDPTDPVIPPVNP